MTLPFLFIQLYLHLLKILKVSLLSCCDERKLYRASLIRDSDMIFFVNKSKKAIFFLRDD